MENIKSETLMSKALKEFEIAHEELNRPQEDLVMIAACELVKKSINDFLSAFLTEKGVSNIPSNDLLALQKECSKVDKAFKKLDYDSIACLSEEDSMAYTNALEDERLNHYVKTLDKTKELVLKSIG